MAIDFDPTYKRDFSQQFGFINKNEQSPSYCDRILYKCNDRNCWIIGNQYNCIEKVLGSDHRPVFLSCTVN